MLGSGDSAVDPVLLSAGVSVAELSSVVSRLGGDLDSTSADPAGRGVNAQRIDRIAVLEQLKSACAAAQAGLSAGLLTDRLADGQAATTGTRRRFDPDQVRRGVAAEIGLARHRSPNRARKMLGLAQALTLEMPCTLAALADGTTSEYRAQLIAQEFGCVSAADPDDRGPGDRAETGRVRNVSNSVGYTGRWVGDARSRHAAAGIAGRLDPAAVLAKIPPDLPRSRPWGGRRQEERPAG